MIATTADGDRTTTGSAALATGAGLTVLAVDDERPALEDLVHLLDAHERVTTVLTAGDGTTAMRILGADPRSSDPRSSDGPVNGVDAVFLDIRMPGVDGLEVAKVCAGLAAPPAVVFVTAHEDKAVAAFDVGAIDYLLKPLHSARLATTLERITAVRGGAGPSPVAEDVVPVELAGTTTMVPQSTVRWVAAHGDYVRLHTGEECHLVRMPLGELEARWRDARFLRVHRSFLVARGAITELRKTISGHVVHVDTGGEPAEVRLPVSRRHLAAVRAELRGGWSDLA